MKRSVGFSKYDAYPKTIMAQNDVYNNMSHHYRRLYSAKPCIDTGLKKLRSNLLQPKERKLSAEWNSCRNRSACQKKLIKCYPNQRDPASQESNRLEIKSKDVLDSIEYTPFHPRILKTDVESKVRSLSVYHPPRKKGPLATSHPNEKKPEDDGEEYNWPRENTSNASKLSSSDSAYTEEGDGMWSGGESRGESPQSPNSCWSMNVRPNSPYIGFLRAITDEVLRKGIFTNKALKRVFREHIYKNRHRLNVQRMEEEVEKLQKELGIPKEDDLNDTDFGLGSVKPEWYLGSNKPMDVDNKGSGDIVESLNQLSLSSLRENEDGDKREEWFRKKKPPSETYEQEKDVKVLFKIPFKEYDNDSSIGCEILSERSENIDDRSV